MGSSAPDFSHSMCDEVLRFKSQCDHLCHFPMEVFNQGGAILKTEGWPEKIFREEDMRPHKNIAYCRDSFQVLLVTQLPLDEIDDLLFDTINGPGGLSNKDLFKIIMVTYEEIKQDS
mmetsp:Transcript_3298/g.3462  ORF Transcript_3298/g.3462 Transcript_3298/m.3462 type:complete len:117 (+) Transcript_3298:442-792(+)